MVRLIDMTRFDPEPDMGQFWSWILWCKLVKENIVLYFIQVALPAAANLFVNTICLIMLYPLKPKLVRRTNQTHVVPENGNFIFWGLSKQHNEITFHLSLFIYQDKSRKQLFHG